MRFIPTRVGNTYYRFGSPDIKTVHPHACGEHTYKVPSMSQRYGSSPRVWGTLACLKGLPYVPRFIPTRVGNTSVCLPFVAL